MATTKKKVNFSIDSALVDRQQELNKVFTGINWSEYVELLMAACLAYLDAAEKSLKDGKVRRPWDVRLPAELHVNFIMSCLIEEFEDLKKAHNPHNPEFTRLHHDLLTSRVRGSVMREWEEAFDHVYSSRTFPVFSKDATPGYKPSIKTLLVETMREENEETKD